MLPTFIDGSVQLAGICMLRYTVYTHNLSRMGRERATSTVMSKIHRQCVLQLDIRVGLYACLSVRLFVCLSDLHI